MIRSFSLAAEKQFDLLAADIGRPIGSIRHGLRASQGTADRQVGLVGADSTAVDLPRLVAEVIAEVREHEQEVHDQAGRWHSLRVRPYRTLDHQVDGAVLMLVNIDTLKRSEQAIAAARDYAQGIVETVREPLVVLDGELKVESANRSFYRTFQLGPARASAVDLELGGRLWDIPVCACCSAVTSQNSSLDD
jgi:two-component system CheB/CheR fusion protein